MCWIKDYLADRSQVTVVNGFQSKTLPVKFGVPQGSVLGPTQFSLFCNDLPDIAGVRECEIHMYADDTTIYVAESSPDKVACVAGGMRERASGGGAANFPRGRSPRVNSRAAKPRVNFPPTTFRMVFTCRPLLSLANQT